MAFKHFAPSLWHLLGLASVRKQAPRRPRVALERPVGPAPPGSMRRRYDDLVVEMKDTYGIRVRKWRTSTSGCAWVVQYHDGTISRLIESPYPRGPMSCAIFLHEIGHHAIGFNTHRLRCLEEYDAWRWSLETMRKKGLNVTVAVEKRMDGAIRYAVRKALRRGLKQLPEQLVPYA
jgi:hypothetical protein